MIHFFIDRPIFSGVISIVVTILGVAAVISLPVAQYPDITPPTIQVTASYTGANANVVADTVAAPLEQEINGVEDMLYMSTVCTNSGLMTLRVTFATGTDLDMAQVLVQNRVAIALPKLPESVRQQGVTTKKQSPSILLAINLISPNNRYDRLYLSNYATINIKDELARVDGVGEVALLGGRDYSMRIWLDPQKLSSLNMTSAEVLAALREQNVQVAAGEIGQPPAPPGTAFQYPIQTYGRLQSAEEFANIVIRTGSDGEVVRVRDVGRAELDARSYSVSTYLDGMPCMMLAVYQIPGSNAIETAQRVRAKLAELETRFPEGVESRIVYDTTTFIEQSVNEVYTTLIIACLLVLLVIMLFLQNWRPTLMPLIAVPVSLIGTFAIMAALGFSLNNLSLFGLVLAIGIVVDDAIVVVENVERLMSKGLSPRQAAHQAMSEITGAVIATSLVMMAVFVPTAFMTGISGEFYRQFALTIAAAVAISTINALTLTPALCAVVLKPSEEMADEPPLPRLGVALILAAACAYALNGLATMLLPGAANAPGLVQLGLAAAGAVLGWWLANPFNRVLSSFFRGFNFVFDRVRTVYVAMVRGGVRAAFVMLAVYALLIGATYVGFRVVPTGFVPAQDKGYLVVNSILPDGASLGRTETAAARIDQALREVPGVAHTLRIAGYSLLTSSELPNSASFFVILDPFEDRQGDASRSADAIAAALRAACRKTIEAQSVVFGAPPIDGLGTTGGFKLQLQDRQASGPLALQAVANRLAEVANQQPGLVGVTTSFRATQPQIFVDVDRTKALSLGVPLSEVFNALQIQFGSAYVNDFSAFSRNWQVRLQADASFRDDVEDMKRLRVRNREGKMVPLATLVTTREIIGPAIVNRYNMFPSADMIGNTAPGVSSGQAITLMEEIARRELPSGMTFEWTELSLQQILAGNTAGIVFALGSVFVFLVLAAQYESWSLPLAIILIVPMCLLAAIGGVWLARMDNNIFTQIGLLVLVGLAAKNAILIVEFAKQRQDEGLSRQEAAIEAANLRLRAILMTALSFVLGVVPLLTASGAGAEMRVALGVAVFSGMLGVTLFGLFFTPVFYSVIMAVAKRTTDSKSTNSSADSSPP